MDIILIYLAGFCFFLGLFYGESLARTMHRRTLTLWLLSLLWPLAFTYIAMQIFAEKFSVKKR